MTQHLNWIHVGGRIVGEEVRIRHTFPRPAHEGSFPFFTIMDRFTELGFYRDLNSSFQRIHDTHSSLPLVTIIREPGTRMILNDDFPNPDGLLDNVEEQNGIYCSDFRVVIAFRDGRPDVWSLPMRFSADTRRPPGALNPSRPPPVRLGQIGVRSVARQPFTSARTMRLGERRATNDMIMRGGSATCWTDLTLIGNAVRFTRPPRPVVEENNSEQWIWCNFSYIVTENGFFLFTRKGGVIKNIISLVRMESMTNPGHFVWHTNGWAEDLATAPDRRLPAGTRWEPAVSRLSINRQVIICGQTLVAPHTVRRIRPGVRDYFQADGMGVINAGGVRAAEGANFAAPVQSIGATRNLAGYDLMGVHRQAALFIAPANTTQLMLRRQVGLGVSNLSLLTQRGVMQRLRQSGDIWYMPAVVIGRILASLAVEPSNENDTELGRERGNAFRALTGQGFASAEDAAAAFGLAFARLSEIEGREYAAIINDNNGFRIQNIYTASFATPNEVTWRGVTRRTVAIVHTHPPVFRIHHASGVIATAPGTPYFSDIDIDTFRNFSNVQFSYLVTPCMYIMEINRSVLHLSNNDINRDERWAIDIYHGENNLRRFLARFD